eukprot:jgi/Bigna1/86431/estExt_fgenesh1_pg.C_100229
MGVQETKSFKLKVTKPRNSIHPLVSPRSKTGKSTIRSRLAVNTSRKKLGKGGFLVVNSPRRGKGRERSKPNRKSKSPTRRLRSPKSIISRIRRTKKVFKSRSSAVSPVSNRIITGKGLNDTLARAKENNSKIPMFSRHRLMNRKSECNPTVQSKEKQGNKIEQKERNDAPKQLKENKCPDRNDSKSEEQLLERFLNDATSHFASETNDDSKIEQKTDNTQDVRKKSIDDADSYWNWKIRQRMTEACLLFSEILERKKLLEAEIKILDHENVILRYEAQQLKVENAAMRSSSIGRGSSAGRSAAGTAMSERIRLKKEILEVKKMVEAKKDEMLMATRGGRSSSVTAM